ncbi:MAG: hypothetical protein M1814_003227 [Vezdaea aestivalis]|nr:MAG: hypothetical protein M1814_003227 [Vezdaea aestivalis]
MLSGILIFNQKGENLIFRAFRNDCRPRLADVFRIQVISNAQVRSPILTLGSTTFSHVKHENIYIVAVTKSNANAALIFEFLYRLIGLGKSYFTKFNEDAVKSNFVLVYELLDEILDFGYPQNTETDTLKLYITTEGVKSERTVEDTSKITMQATGALSWRRSDVKYRKNEAFVDVIEDVNLLMSAQGQVLRADVNGQIQMRAYLTGTPECKFGLNDRLLLDRDSLAPSGNRAGTKATRAAAGSVTLEDCQFHQCVKLGKFDTDRTISFIPPDGEFELMRYRATDNVNLPFKVHAIVTEVGKTKVEYSIAIKSNFGPKLYATNVIVRVPTPLNTAATNERCSQGKAKYEPEHNNIVWKIARFTGQSEFVLSADATLTSMTNQKAWSRPPISLNFSLLMFTSSGLLVRYLKVFEKSNYSSVKWVRYMTRAGSYEISWSNPVTPKVTPVVETGVHEHIPSATHRHFEIRVKDSRIKMFSRFRSNTQPSSSPACDKLPIPPPFAINPDHVDNIEDPLDLANDFEDLLLRPEPARFAIASHRSSSFEDEAEWDNFSRPMRRSRVVSLQSDLLSPEAYSTRIFSQPLHSIQSISTPPCEPTPDPRGSGEEKNRPFKPGRLDSWFKGVSEPVSIGLPVKEQVLAEKEDEADKAIKRPNKLKKNPESLIMKTSTSSTSRFSFFNIAGKDKPATPPDDEILALVIPQELKETSIYSANSYNALLLTSTSLLSRTQDAYKERSSALKTLSEAHSAKLEELEEAETRTQHLKMQLATFASKLDEHESAMQEMATDLAEERQRRRQEQMARKRSIALVKAPPELQQQFQELSEIRSTTRDSAIAIDLSSSSECSFESEDDTSACDSVFSRPSTSGRDGAPSPTSTILSAPSSELSGLSNAAYVQAVAQTIIPFRISEAKPPLHRQSSLFQRCLGDATGQEMDDSKCQNCHGASTSKAWSVVGQLRQEKEALTGRCLELERTVEETLNLVGDL